MLKQNAFTITFLEKAPSLLQSEQDSNLRTFGNLIDNILTADISNNSLKKGITKSEVLNHFPIFFLIQLTKEKLREGVIKVKKRVLNNRNMNSFREQLSLLHWRQTDLELRTWQVIRNNQQTKSNIKSSPPRN